MPLVSAKKFVASVATAHTSVSDGPTDVCKTPAAPSPLPLPYPNIAVSTTMGSGYATKVLVVGTPTWTKRGKTAVSNGDQPGTLFGVISNKIMGRCGIIMASTDVKAERGGVVRTLDSSNSNG
ncbi:PAAR-like domain-containing protein [Sorangium sp. So ce406]|uniref:PAAR-like domain-containing protein n=1 Tax=Sorangium sp. So ce406 TaxID=3133311 RepID=UPI003F5C2E83